MDQSRFDDLTRTLGGSATRRAGLRAALGGILGLAVAAAALPAAETEARRKRKRKACRQTGAPCSMDADCCSGLICDPFTSTCGV